MVNSSKQIRFLLAMLLLQCGLAEGATTSGEKPRITAFVRLIDEAEVAARSAGLVTSIQASEGDYVRAGQTLAQLDPIEAELAVDAARLEHAIAQHAAEDDVAVRYAAKAAEVAEAELARSKHATEQFKRSVSQSQIDVEQLTAEQARLERERAERDLQQARLTADLKASALRAAEVALERQRIVAPIDGMVVERTLRLGQGVEPGYRAFRLVQTDRLRAEAFVLSDVANRLQAAGPVRILYPGGTLEGKLRFVSPEVDPVNQQVRLIVEFDNHKAKLRPGDRVELELATAAGGS